MTSSSSWQEHLKKCAREWQEMKKTKKKKEKKKKSCFSQAHIFRLGRARATFLG